MFTKHECQATDRILAGNLQDANIPAPGPATTEEPASRLPLPGQPVTRVIRREHRTSLTANLDDSASAGRRCPDLFLARTAPASPSSSVAIRAVGGDEWAVVNEPDPLLKSVYAGQGDVRGGGTRAAEGQALLGGPLCGEGLQGRALVCLGVAGTGAEQQPQGAGDGPYLRSLRVQGQSHASLLRRRTAATARLTTA
jgi:hypothetical protein